MHPKLKTQYCLLAVLTLVFAALLSFAPAIAHAQDAGQPAVALSTAGTDVPVDVVATLLTKYSWLSATLAAFGAASVVYQALIAWAHKRAAETADDADDKWLASLETKGWFKLLDRLFYWGGYLGAKFGGRKL